jgi:hypothetical protein
MSRRYVLAAELHFLRSESALDVQSARIQSRTGCSVDECGSLAEREPRYVPSLTPSRATDCTGVNNVAKGLG